MIENKPNEFLWVEKYRPQKVADCILPERIKGTFQQIVDSGELQHFLLYGAPGTGKCLSGEEHIKVKIEDNIIDLTLLELFTRYGAEQHPYDEPFDVQDQQLFVPNKDGDWVMVRHLVRKRDHKLKLYFQSGTVLHCGQHHLLLGHKNLLQYARDAEEVWNAHTQDYDFIVKKEKTDFDDVFDIAIDAPHLYRTPNGLVHHNTTLAKAVCDEMGLDNILINASENGNIDTLRTTIRNYASTMSFSSKYKVVILDESDNLNCVEEHEGVRLGDGSEMPLKDMMMGHLYDVLSVNMETCEVEPDIAEVVMRNEREVFEVELENSMKIKVTDDHPFIVTDAQGNLSTRTIKEGFEGVEIVLK